ncbi:Flagellar hook-associated protein 2 [Gallionellaceae bacterium]|nr:Flagellar hook-associated protein 2 [Gallionellaceae bacterium]
MATTSATSGSNIDVASIVSQLMTVEQRPLAALAKKEASYQAKLSAIGTLQGALSSFQSALLAMSDISKFQTMTAASSDSMVLSATATSKAIAGTYTLDVTSLAQAQKLVAAGQTSSTAGIGTGVATTLTFDFGTIAGGTFDSASGKYTGSTFTSNGNGTKTVTIDATNNSLQGIRDAINSANVGVTATIINDGSGTPYRLALASSAIGSSNSLKVSVAGDAALGSLLAHDPAATQNLSETVTAQNANFKVNGVSVSKSSNTVTDVIEGVTLTLQKTTTTSASVTVARDTASIQSSVAAFAKAYNDLNKTLKDVSSYDPATKKGAILQGDAVVRGIQSQVRAMLNNPVSGAGALTHLSQIGVTFQKDGTLAVDSTKLSAAITSNPTDIAALFATVGKASDSLVSYTSAASTVKAGSYAVNIAQLATQGNLVGSAAVGTLTIATGSNDALNVTVNGVSTSVTLAAGTYTAATLAAEVQAKINGASALSSAGASVAVTESGGVFTLTSNSYGSTSNVTVSGTGAINLLGGAPISTAGLDVAGTIDGQAATGSGQFLTGDAGNVLGLKVQVSGGALGARGTVNYSHGYSYTLDNLMDSMLASDGLIAGKTKGLNSSITDIGKQRDALNVRLAALQKQYTAQFAALDVMLSKMNQTSLYLTQQLATLSNMNS